MSSDFHRLSLGVTRQRLVVCACRLSAERHLVWPYLPITMEAHLPLQRGRGDLLDFCGSVSMEHHIANAALALFLGKQ